MNILTIYGNKTSLKPPSYSYYIRVPNGHGVLFLNDCHYHFSCDVYCLISSRYSYEEDSEVCKDVIIIKICLIATVTD